MTSNSDVLRMFEVTIQRFGRVDIVLNNAGIGGERKIEIKDAYNG